MKKYIKLLSLILAICLLATVFTACKKKDAGDDADGIWGSQYEKADDYDTSIYEVGGYVDTLDTNENLAENEHYVLGWNAENESVTLVTKKDGKKWGTNPNDYYELNNEQKVHEMINSPLTVQFALKSKPTDINVGGSIATLGRIGSTEIDNGVSVTYYFDEYYFSVTVDYYLEGDSVKVKIDPKKIVEAGENQIVAIGVTPFMCSVKNTENGSRDSYLVIPSGSGALMYADQRASGAIRSISASVYGDDAAIDQYQNPDNNTAMSMPFFGAKEGNSATVGIIESGSEFATIKADAGESKYGVSEVYAYVDVRGHDIAYLQGIWRNKYTKEINDVEPIVIGYYALSGEDASYYGIAKRYRDYLVEKENLKVTGSNKLLNATILGSYLKDELFLGFPYKKAEALTTYSQATTILSELKDITTGSLSATMLGFGEGGVNATKLAGGYKLTGITGKKEDLTSFVNFASDNGIDAYFNFDVINFSKSGAGFSTTGDAAINNTGINIKVRQFMISTRNRIEEAEGGRIGALVARKELKRAVLTAADTAAKYDISNIAFNTLGSISYADYNDDDAYTSRKNMTSDVKEYISEVQAKNNKVLVDSPFSYAATQADVLTGCPINSNNDRAFDVDVPLYQIVFQGFKENYIQPINYAADRRIAFLKAIESGSGISFILMNNYDIELRKQYDNIFGSSLYSDNKGYIKEYLAEGGDFLESVASAKIKSHTILAENVTKTEFDNGKVVYVNFSTKSATVEGVTVPAQDFIVK